MDSIKPVALAAAPTPPLAAPAAQALQGAQPAFGDVLQNLLSDAVMSLRSGETAATNAMVGKGTIQQAVEGVMQAEQSLSIAIAVRDKVVAAYLEISRMQI